MHGVRSLLSMLLKNGEGGSGKKEKLNISTWYIIINLGVFFISVCVRTCVCVGICHCHVMSQIFKNNVSRLVVSYPCC